MKHYDIKFGRYSTREFVKKIIHPVIMYYRQKTLLHKLRDVGELNVKRYGRVLIIAPHPDDEVIGIGGYILQQQRNGAEIFIIYLTDGEQSLPDISNEKIAINRIELSIAVLGQMNIPLTNVTRMHLPDGNVPHENEHGFAKIVTDLASVIDTIRPDAVFVSYIYDMHEDHVASFQIVREALRKIDRICDLYGYWVWLWYLIPIKRIKNIDWKNTIPINIKDENTVKKQLMDMYLKPKADTGDPWSGNLPPALINAFNYPQEVITKYLYKH
jgi:LmbE family N-acetylglucosaminyl deacetylase